MTPDRPTRRSAYSAVGSLGPQPPDGETVFVAIDFAPNQLVASGFEWRDQDLAVVFDATMRVCPRDDRAVVPGGKAEDLLLIVTVNARPGPDFEHANHRRQRPTVESVFIALTDAETNETANHLEALVETREKGWHAHVMDERFWSADKRERVEQEVTVYPADDSAVF
jgi:hypothetical protein